MLYVHYLDPHGTYTPPPEYYKKFSERDTPIDIEIYWDVRSKLTSLVNDGFGPGDERFEDLVNRYDAEIAHTDASIESLFDGLREMGVLDNTLIILTADHGEEFLDHGFVVHAWTLYQECIQVPMIAWWPEKLKPQRVNSLVSNTDIFPTLQYLLQAPDVGMKLDGRSLFQYNEADELTVVEESRPVFAELLIDWRGVVRAVVYEDWKYIAAQRWLDILEREECSRIEGQILRAVQAGKPLLVDKYGPPVHEELYNLAEDPGEQLNRIGASDSESRAAYAQLKFLMDSYVAEVKASGMRDTLETSILEKMTQEERDAMAALGYL